MHRKVIHSEGAPKAIGPYSQAIEVTAATRTLYCSGQIPLDPKTGEFVPGDVVAQAERVLLNLEAVLAEAKMTFANVVRSTIFLKDLGDFAKVNEVYARRFSSEPPARVTVQAAALPRGALVEIDAIAVA
ncbi:MAG: RidA family protein [Myxococcaceae bacterium]